MKKSRRCGLGTTICRGLLFVLLAVCLHTAPKAYALGGDLADADLNKMSSWESGYLDEKTGEEFEHRRRIRTKEYYTFDKDNYEVSYSNTDFTLSAYYYDANMKFVSVQKLYDGCVISKNDTAKYIRLTYIKNVNEKTMSPGQFGSRVGITLFADIKASVIHESEVFFEVEEDIDEQFVVFEDMNVTSKQGWTSAGMDKNTGELVTNKRRLATEAYYPIYEQTLSVSFNKEGFSVEVYEYDADKNFIKMTVASNNSEVTVTDKTRFVRFSLFKNENEKTLSSGQWGRLFSGGLSMAVCAIDDTNNVVTVSEPSPKLAPAPKQEFTPHDELYNEMKQMLVTGDTSRHDISKYGFDIYEVRAIADELRQGECYYYFANSSSMFLSDFSLKNNICYTMRFEGMDSDFVNRYNRMMNALNEIKAMTSSQMSDLDKVILVHEYIVQHAYYEKTSSVRGCTGGILGDGHGLCAGYAHAFIDALKYLGIEAKYVSSNDMNHAWSLVKIDGQYYHVDCTWDNTIEEDKGYLGHNYLLASDTRFAKSIPGRHYNWTVAEDGVTGGVKIPASNTKYDSWFVHDVKGIMVYSNGYWYYADGKTVKKSDAYGKSMSTVLTETANVSIIGLSQGKLQYKVNGVVKSISVK